MLPHDGAGGCWPSVQGLERRKVGGQICQHELVEMLRLLQVLEAVGAQVTQAHPFRQRLL